jgi:hypothetical protein
LSTDKAHSYYKGDTILYTDVTWVLSTDKAHSYYKGDAILYTDVTWVLSTDKAHSLVTMCFIGTQYSGNISI